MARIKELKTNFVAGELDPLLLQRSDVEAYFNAAEYMRNVVALPQGGAVIRPGSRFRWEVPEVSAGVLSNTRCFEFQFSTEQAYLFVFHHLSVSIFMDGVLQATIATPWTSTDIRAQIAANGDLISSGITVTQSRDTMLVFHQDHQPRIIKRNGSHTAWTIAAYSFFNMPRFDFGDTAYVNGVDEVQELEFPRPTGGEWENDDTFHLILEDEKTTNIKYSSDASTMRSRIQAALRKLPQSGVAGITVTISPGGTTGTSDATFVVTFTGTERPWGVMYFETTSTQQVPTIEIVVTTEGERPGENVWSNTRGWPRCGVFFQGRLWLAGTKSLPNSVWATRSGSFQDLNSRKIDDDYGIFASTDTDDVPAFLNIFAGRHLQLFSTSGEFYIPVSENEAVTPGNIVLRRSTSRGSKAGLRVYEVDGATIFIQRQGKALREFIFADVELAYQANAISLLASHLMRDPVGFAIRRATSTDDADLLFMPNADGSMSVFCTLRTQKVNAMTLWTTQGAYHDVGVVLSDVFFVTTRTIDGVQKRFLEVMDEEIYCDCGAKGGAGTGTTLAHLPDTLIEYSVDGFEMEPVTASGAGAITFDREAEESWWAGLKYPEVLPDEYPGFIYLIKTLPVELQLQDGASMGRKRRIVSVDVRMYQTRALTVNGVELAFQEFGEDVLDTPIPPFTGVKRERGFLGYDFEGQVALGSPRSTSATILGLAYTVSIG
jgi:hypothetical protein